MTEKLKIDGMHCGGCLLSVRRAIERLPVKSVVVEPGSATVDFDEAQVTHKALVEALEDAGYTVVEQN
jgi:copper chaperone CopZ